MELDPAAVRQGRDLQLEKAVEVVMDCVEKESAAAVQEAGISELSLDGWAGEISVGLVRVVKFRARSPSASLRAGSRRAGENARSSG